MTRRYLRHWGAIYMWTLTYGIAASSWSQVVANLRRFFERMRAVFGKLPILAVIERGTGGTKRLHVHFATDRWLPKGLVHDLWTHGFVHVGVHRKHSGLQGYRFVAKYLSKYLQKQGEAEAAGNGDRPAGAHRYLCTKVGHPRSFRSRHSTYAQALAKLIKDMGVPDGAVAFGDWDSPHVHGTWFVTPDATLAPVDPPS